MAAAFPNHGDLSARLAHRFSNLHDWAAFPAPVGRLGRSRRSPPVYPLTRNEGLAVPSRFLASFAALDFFARRLVCWLTKRTQHHSSREFSMIGPSKEAAVVCSRRK